MEKKLLNLTELSQYIGMSKRTLYHMISENRFPVEPLRGTNPRLWSVEQIDTWLRGDGK